MRASLPPDTLIAVWRSDFAGDEGQMSFFSIFQSTMPGAKMPNKPMPPSDQRSPVIDLPLTGRTRKGACLSLAQTEQESRAPFAVSLLGSE